MKAYKYKLKPSAKIIAIYESWLALLCELYNAGLQERRDAYRINHLSISYKAQANQLPEIKKDRPEFAQIHSQVIQDALKRLDSAFDGFFRRVKEGQKPGYPRFRSIFRYDSFRYPQSGFSLKGGKLHLSKIGKVKVHLSRPIEGEIKTCTIKREADGWYVIFALEEQRKEIAPAPKESVGVDVGIESFATLSDDEAAPIGNPRYFRRAEMDLKKAQRRVSRRDKGSKGRKKAVGWLGKKHLKVKRQRRDFHYLPSEYAASLTRAAAPVNIASTMQFIPLIGAVEDQIVECFLNGGAPPYSSHPRFQEALAGESVEDVAPALSTLMESILPLVPGMAEAICTPGDSA